MDAAEVRPQAEAIKANRSLLADPDPVPGLVKTLSDELRKALVAARAAYEKTYETQLEALEATRWKEVGTELQSVLLQHEELDTIPALSVGTNEDLLRSLRDCSPEQWKTRTDALPTPT